MATELFNHAKSEDGPLCRVVQDVQTDQSRIEIAVIEALHHSHSVIISRNA